MNVPTNWQQMRYCVVAALQVMGGENESDRSDIYSESLKFTIERLFNFDYSYVDWDTRGSHGKAYERAMDDLKRDGTVIVTDWGIRLATWGES